MSAKIMIVDDSEMVATMHSGILRKAGFQCSVAENGAVALELIMADHFDMIISDVNMPRMNGYQLVEIIRKTAGYESVPVIMISTEMGEKDVVQAMEAGANLYVVKPASAKHLLASVLTLLKAS